MSETNSTEKPKMAENTNNVLSFAPLARRAAEATAPITTTTQQPDAVANVMESVECSPEHAQFLIQLVRDMLRRKVATVATIWVEDGEYMLHHIRALFSDTEVGREDHASLDALYCKRADVSEPDYFELDGHQWILADYIVRVTRRSQLDTDVEAAQAAIEIAFEIGQDHVAFERGGPSGVQPIVPTRALIARRKAFGAYLAAVLTT